MSLFTVSFGELNYRVFRFMHDTLRLLLFSELNDDE